MRNKYIIRVIYGFIGMIIGIILLLSLCACNESITEVEAKNEFPLYMKTIDEGHIETFCYYRILEDERTKVEYLVVFSGNSKGGFAITPLYDTNGNLYKENRNG